MAFYDVSDVCMASALRGDVPTSHCRFAIAWTLRKGLGFSYQRIADKLRRKNHTTIIHALRRAEEMRDKDREFRALTDDLLATIDAP